MVTSIFYPIPDITLRVFALVLLSGLSYGSNVSVGALPATNGCLPALPAMFRFQRRGSAFDPTAAIRLKRSGSSQEGPSLAPTAATGWEAATLLVQFAKPERATDATTDDIGQLRRGRACQHTGRSGNCTTA
jgi:hypothetical protein